MNKILLSLASTALVLAAPAAAFASTFAYVNSNGEVMTVEAASAAQALVTAPNIDIHSGVMIMDSADDQNVLSQHVNGA